MRAISTTSKLLTFVAAALGVAFSLGLPWFAASPAAVEARTGELPTIDGPVEVFFGGVYRWVTAPDGASAAERFAGADTALLILVALACTGAGLNLLRGAEPAGRWLMQVTALGVLGLVVVKLVQVSGTDALVETRHGGLVAAACGLMMVVTAGHVAQQKLRRTPPETMTALHDPSLRAPRSAGPSR
jgi:hypothetical protein